MAGDVFQLGNTSWKHLGVVAGTVRVEDARGQPPGMPFWLGEGPAAPLNCPAPFPEFRWRVEKRIEESLETEVTTQENAFSGSRKGREGRKESEGLSLPSSSLVTQVTGSSSFPTPMRRAGIGSAAGRTKLELRRLPGFPSWSLGTRVEQKPGLAGLERRRGWRIPAIRTSK